MPTRNEPLPPADAGPVERPVRPRATGARRIDTNKTIYDQRVQVDERVRKAAPRLHDALRDLLEAVLERPALAESIESATLQRARQLLAELLA